MNNQREIIAHFFQWKLKHITEVLDIVQECGYTTIQISPVQGCKDDGNEFWKLYQPLDMAIINSNQIGTKEDLIELCNEAHKRNIKVVADVVLRHTASVDTGELIPHEKVSKRLSNNPHFWTHSKNAKGSEKDRWEVTHFQYGIPMLNYYNFDLQDIYIEFLAELKESGCDGFRVDMAKHLITKEEDSSCYFWDRVFGRFSDMFNYAECLECDKTILDKYTKFINVITDYYLPTDKSKAVIYISSHDTEETWGFTKKMTDNDIEREWEIMLKNNRNSHVMFYLRPFSDSWKSDRMKYINNTYK